ANLCTKQTYNFRRRLRRQKNVERRFAMMVSKRSNQGGLIPLLHGEQVRRALTQDGRTLYAAVDVVAALSGARQPAEYWADLKVRERGLADLCNAMTWSAGADAAPVTLDGVDVEGVLRLVQSI